MQDQRDDGGFLGRPAWLWSVGALVLGLAVSVVAASLHHEAIARAERTTFERRAERSFDAVETQLRSCALLVRSVQALFLTSDALGPAEFDAIYSNLRPRVLFPSLQAIAYAQRVTTPGAPDRFPTRLVAPRLGNERLLGLDVVSQPANLRGVLASRDSDEPAMSGGYPLFQRQG
jgi:CHASE1-domain containing sensor protein